MAGKLNKRDQGSALVFVVSLNAQGSGPMRRGFYFHPHGPERARGGRWPDNYLPNFIGFRRDGHLLSVHHVKRVRLGSRYKNAAGRWVLLGKPHIIYDLGRAMKPPKPLPNGPRVKQARHCACLLDTLLFGHYPSISAAETETRRRGVRPPPGWL